MRRLVLAALAMLVLMSSLRTAAETLRPLTRGDCQVMEEHLRSRGHEVRVEAGKLAARDGLLWAVLVCRTREGAVFTWAYPLGPLEGNFLAGPGDRR